MPRPKTVSDEVVVRAAARVLHRIGPARFTLADVATEAELSPATLVQRFGSKRGLMLAFARWAAARAAEPFERARTTVASPLGALRAALLDASKDVRSRSEVANSLAVLLVDISDNEMRAAAALHAQATEQAIHALLTDAAAAGELSATSIELTKSVHAAWQGAIIQWALRSSGPF